MSKIVSRPNSQKNISIFDSNRTGYKGFKPLTHKDGTNLKDWEYLELLGRKCLELDKKNKNKMIPTDYGHYNRQVCELAKQVCKGVDSGMTSEELTKYVSLCVEYK